MLTAPAKAHIGATTIEIINATSTSYGVACDPKNVLVSAFQPVLLPEQRASATARAKSQRYEPENNLGA